MADQIALKAVTGRQLGSASSRRLRHQGQIPAVVYGLDSEPLAVAVEYREARGALSTDAGLNALLTLDIDGTAETCVVKDLQRHVTRDEVTHIDFLRVDPNAAIEVEVPLVLVGEARAVTQVSGMVDQALFALNISTKPTSIPNEIEVDVTDMEVGDTIRVQDLVLPEGVEPAHRLQATIATAMVTRSTLEALRADEEAEAAEDAAVEGAAPEADTDAGD